MTGTEESPLQFPCEFPIKAVGRAEHDIEGLVTAIAQCHVPSVDTAAVTCRASRNGRYRSATVTVTATSRAQLDAIYRDLSDCDRLLWVL